MRSLENLIAESISRISENKIDVYSYAVCFDHESKRRFSICVDTRENSIATVASGNKWTEKHFKRFLDEDDGDSIVNFSANSGRNYSLGNFKYRNLASLENEEDVDFSNADVVGVIKAVISRQDEITMSSSMPEDVLFSCSTKDDEFGVSWFRITPTT